MVRMPIMAISFGKIKVRLRNLRRSVMQNWSNYFSMRDWLKSYLNSQEGRQILQVIEEDEKQYAHYPILSDRFNAYNIKQEDIKIVLSDAYPDIRQPMFDNGYAWSNTQNIWTPKGDLLRWRIERDFQQQIEMPYKFDFSSLSQQGVFMPHQHLTLRWRADIPHPQHYWDTLYWEALKYLVLTEEPKVFILICRDPGLFRTKALQRLNRKNYKHLILPSYDMGVFNRRINYFYSSHTFLKNRDIQPVNWTL